MPRVIISSVDNRSIGFGNNDTPEFQLASGPFAVNPAYPLTLSFYMNITGSTTGYISPSVGLSSLIQEISVSSVMTNETLSLIRFYPQAVMQQIATFGPYEQQTAGHLSKQAVDYYSQHTLINDIAITKYGAGNYIRFAVPLYVDIFSSPDMLNKPLSDFGGLKLRLKLASDSNVFYDTASTPASYRIYDLNLHYSTMFVSDPKRDMSRPVFMRSLDMRTGELQTGNDTRSISLNSAAQEAIILTAIPAAKANAFSGDSQIAQRLTPTTSGVELNTSQNTAVLSMNESVNGIQMPISNILNMRSDSMQAEVMLLEYLKALYLEVRPKKLKSVSNFYNYEHNVLFSGNASVNKSYLPATSGLTLYDGLSVLPNGFALGYLINKGGLPLQNSSTSMQIISSITEIFLSFVYVRTIRQVSTTIDKKSGATLLGIVN